MGRRMRRRRRGNRRRSRRMMKTTTLRTKTPTTMAMMTGSRGVVMPKARSRRGDAAERLNSIVTSGV